MLHPRAIIQRSCDVVVQESNLSSPPHPPFQPTRPRATFTPSPPPRSFFASTRLKLFRISDPGPPSFLLLLPRDLFNDATGKIREGGNASGPVQTANRIDYPPSSPRYPRAEIFVCTIRFSHAWRRWNLLTAERWKFLVRTARLYTPEILFPTLVCYLRGF